MLRNYARKDGGEPLETKLAHGLTIKSEGESEEYLEIMGYGSVFGNRDNRGDIVMPGAFKECIASGRRVKMLWQHDARQPIGVWDEMSEDENGLRMNGRVAKKGKGGEVAALVKMGAIDGLSIGYRTQEYEMDVDNGARKLTKLDLWETSVVTFPMNEMAGIYAMKAEEMTQRDLERALRDMGHSKRMAVAMAGGAWKGRADVLRDADGGVDPERFRRDADELKRLLNETLQEFAK